MIVEGAVASTVCLRVGDGSSGRMTSQSGENALNISGDEKGSERSRAGQNTTAMAHSKCLYDIPYGVTREIVMSMDADKSWELLAGEIGYSFDKLKHFELEYQKYAGSPTKALLWDWGSQNATVKDLYNKLKVLNRIREMKIIENYVARTKDTYFNNAEKTLNCMDPPKKDNSLPVMLSINTDDLPGPPPPRRRPSEVETDTSEVNFNQPKGHMTKSNVSSKICVDSGVKDKQYDDKKIPGTTLDSNVPHHSNRVPQESISMATSDSGKALESTDSLSFNLSGSEKSDSMKELEALQSYMKTDNLSLNDAVALMGTPIFEYKELHEATDGFSTSHKLGAGAFGTVYQGLLRSSPCAIKRLESDKKNVKDSNTSQLRSELTALLRYRHENIVNLYGYALDGPSLCLVYQYMKNGSLEDRLQCKGGTAVLPWLTRISIASGAAKGLHFLHSFGSKPLIHGDIKSANILLDKHMEAKIGDLGQAQHANSAEFTGKFTHITQKNANSKLYGTRAYLAPEVQRGGTMSVKSDIYAFGVVLLEICSGKKAMDDKREVNRFLPQYFLELQDTAKEDERKLCALFRDQRAGECPDSIVMDLICCATNCTHEKKKNRIEMEKLLNQLDGLEEKMKEQSTSPSSIVSSMSVHSNHLSHSSGDDYSSPNLAEPTGKVVHPYKQAEAAKEAGEQPASPIEFFKGKEFSSLPEAFKLQIIADANKGGKSIDQIEMYKALNKLREQTETTEDAESDPVKMAEIRKYNMEFEGKNLTHVSSNPALLQSDPNKLEALKQFDKNKSMTREPDESVDTEIPGHYIPAADPVKIKKIEEFDRQWSSGSMPSGLLYGDQGTAVHKSPSVASPVQSPRKGMDVSPLNVVEGIGHLNISPHQSYDPHAEVHHTGQMSHLPQAGELDHCNLSPTNNSGHFGSSGSYFSNESQPTIIRANLTGSDNNVRQQSPGSPAGGPCPHSFRSGCSLEVCEGTTPMAKLHDQLVPCSVPRQQTNTNTSEHITYVVANDTTYSLPEQRCSGSRDTDNCTVTDVLRSSSYPGSKGPYNPVVRQSEGFQYTGCFDQKESYSFENYLHGGSVSDSPYNFGGHLVDGHYVEGEEHSFEDEGHIVEGEGHIVEGEGQMTENLEHSNAAHVGLNSDMKDNKMKHFFESYKELVANASETEGVVEGGENEGEEGQVENEGEDDDSVTHINV